MKKLLLIITILSLLVPLSLTAQTPTDQEVEEATIGVMTLFGLVFMSSMFGAEHEGATMEMDPQTGASNMVFKDFGVSGFMTSMASAPGGPQTEELPQFPFKTMTGTIKVNQGGDFFMDIQLKGGNVKRLEMETTGEDLITLKANGENFSHLQEIFEKME